MTIRQELANVRALYEMQTVGELRAGLREMGVDPLEIMDMNVAEMIDKLMALEEHAAFH